MKVKFLHYWLAIAIMVVAAFNLPDYERASYDALLAILNMLFAIFWTLEEKE